MLVITGSAGFIGSNLIEKLNQENYKDIVLVDDFSKKEKNKNWCKKIFSEKVDRKNFFLWLEENHKFVQFIFHIGARTDTTEFNKKIFDELNLNYSKKIWNLCVKYGLPLIYASSAATYGMGEFGYDDNHKICKNLKPLNPYGASKNDFDKWVLSQNKKPYFWVGLKFFNVYGPNEYHKGRMASVILHSYIVKVIYFFMKNRKNSGIYNLGTGNARTFYELAKSVFNALNKKENIKFIDTPLDIRDKYQYFTEAKMDKLISINYKEKFTSLEDGINDYVKNYLDLKI
ncbi:MAG: ADP-L-glycero-D-mannoheptose-6-epimerase [Bacteroidetes bacterium 4572_128]|nr:MAG: ADP-L-glycero-D-mannoheptose-6-epimerase [Bacteroidetes bacterium 4572_128]